ncbi:5-oxoprolinase subunit PxpA [Pseudidiomarina marina]|uniref:LamB/YcsF family protein n=1 Tax=Pseudidiomarina marina TaxID=502366 RepID=A0A432YJ05_9GAMM|nr:5-oxoprolinase subunit PxpA [Pseudidiomarina marina]RUO60957.1 hypothetical protein CWI76_01360 [Pseudidiomarina marina]
MIKLNCDMGESFAAWTMGDDAAVMPHVDMANIACGFHAGGPAIMAQTIQLAVEHQVEIGAHPAYPDLAGFGRRTLHFPQAELKAILHYQIGAIRALCLQAGAQLSYVKPHGALYNDMQRDQELFELVCRVIAEQNNSHPAHPPLYLLTLARANNTTQQRIAEYCNVELCFEAFADRRYEPDGSLRSRQYADAVFTDRETILDQAKAFACGEPIIASDGSQLRLQPQTLCVHGDNAESIATVVAIRQVLNGI